MLTQARTPEALQPSLCNAYCRVARFDIRMKRTPGEHQTGGLHLHALVGDDGHALHLDQVRARSNPNPNLDPTPTPNPNPKP